MTSTSYYIKPNLKNAEFYLQKFLFNKAKSKIVTYIRGQYPFREGRGYLTPHNSRTNYIGRLNFLWHLHLIIYDLPWKTKTFILNIFCFIRQNSKLWHTYGAISQLGRGGGYLTPHNSRTNYIGIFLLSYMTYPENFRHLSLILFVL